ncbi:ABC transporter ATP-binding protein [Actinomadura sp. DC4]|uniref:ABC transporter ATP-binding protein n=1 Tax=Actinomadura sp. DC4 TaxID=3055069 RepID=UPI0025B100E4|nr:ABC transporter ATP-binding protein [Actinomadura sp. DC4]MDN3354296.1 ABC transporter ATP-binding protein [Actinomadura sp. DC4]
MSAAKNILEVEDLTVAYGAVRALGGVTLAVPEGSVTAVLGANGAGKTTLLRTLSGLLRPRDGRIALDGRDIGRTSVEDIVRAGLAHVPEGRGVIVELTVEENLRLGGLIRRDADGWALGDVYDLFPPLRERARRQATTLSGGERQMLAIGRALMSNPRLLLLDEPSLGLAPRLVAQIMAVLLRMRDDRGLTVLLVEQNARSALSIADRAIVFNLGVIAIDKDARLLAGDDRLRHAYLGF